tara:strand:+ start:6739 stop:6960 length:222 start_codon:yes stop_codon:yes gene_type:complete
MIDELSGSRFWGVVVSFFDRGKDGDKFYVQTCQTKDASYVEKILREIHPEYLTVAVTAIERPPHLKRCLGDPE